MATLPPPHTPTPHSLDLTGGAGRLFPPHTHLFPVFPYFFPFSSFPHLKIIPCGTVVSPLKILWGEASNKSRTPHAHILLFNCEKNLHNIKFPPQPFLSARSAASSTFTVLCSHADHHLQDLGLQYFHHPGLFPLPVLKLCHVKHLRSTSPPTIHTPTLSL